MLYYICIEDIYYNEYFTFISIFGFFDFNHLLPLLFTISKIYSNVYVDDDQLSTFFQIYRISKGTYDLFKEYVKNNECKLEKTEKYHLKDAYNFFQTSTELMRIINNLKYFITTHIFSFSRAERIILRFTFYYKHPGANLPPEKCFNKWIRILFTQNLHPYSYNYGYEDPNEKRIEEFIQMLRSEYSYIPAVRRLSSRPLSAHSHSRRLTNGTGSHNSRGSCSLLYLHKSKYNNGSLYSSKVMSERTDL